MKSFHCNSCGMMVFFENTLCVKCEKKLGFLPQALNLNAIEPLSGDHWQSVPALPDKPVYRLCANGLQHKICNWLVPVDDPNSLCQSCRLNEIIPDLTVAGNLARWGKLELAKRRCIYTFLNLNLPLKGTPGTGQPSLTFRFLGDTPDVPVITGHDKGVITINIAEADDDEREHRRLNLREHYRTLVGHFRHESGHYFWDRLIAGSPHLKRCRELFGDETADYDQALKNYYANGPAADWQSRTVTAYASSHPWEDWAETWAHYLHIMDTLETAACFGVSLNPDHTAESSIGIFPIQFERRVDFDTLLKDWTVLTGALNTINRGMGLADIYPFVVPGPVIEKLRFIHQVISEVKRSARDENQRCHDSKPELVAA